MKCLKSKLKCVMQEKGLSYLSNFHFWFWFSCFCDGGWSLISDLQKGAQMLPHLRPLWISFPYESPFSITYSVAGNNTPYDDFTMKNI